MPSPLSVDLRERVVAAVAAGASCRRAAARFGVSVSSASRWSQRSHQEGHFAPKPMGGDHTSQAIEAHAALILATSEQEPRLFLRELRDRLAEQGVQTSTSGLSRFFARHRITRKKGRCTQLSRSARTSGPPAKLGLRRSPSSIRTGSCSWTRRPLPPTWRGATVGRHAASAAGSHPRRGITRPRPSLPPCARAGCAPPRCLMDPRTARASAAMSARPSSRCCSLTTSSSWTTCQPTRSLACRTRSRPRGLGCSTFRPTVLISTRSGDTPIDGSIGDPSAGLRKAQGAVAQCGSPHHPGSLGGDPAGFHPLHPAGMPQLSRRSRLRKRLGRRYLTGNSSSQACINRRSPPRSVACIRQH